MRKKRIKKRRSVGLVLWFSFFAFAVLVIFVCECSQMALLRQISKEQTYHNLENAKTDIVQKLQGLPPSSISGYLIRAAETYDVNVRLISESGALLFPIIGTDADTNTDYSEELKGIREHNDCIYALDSSTFAYACEFVDLNGDTVYYLYITDTVYVGTSAFWSIMIFQTVYVALIMIIVLTVISGALSMYISRPITDLTEKAQKMSYGNLSVDFKAESGFGYSEIVELSEALNYAESELSKADQMQKELIANVSHDFKTPLTMIKAYASMIQEISGDNPEKRAKHTQVIIDEADRLASLVNDMLDLSKIRAGIDAVKPALFNLSDCLRTVVDRFDYLCETAGYRFVMDIADDLYVEADKNKIAQVLYNLIGNAVNYTGEDKTVTIRLYGENGLQHFSVTDTGKGIAPEEINAIWERYYRSAETHKRPVKGTGLGLSIVKTILTKHGFDFGVRSEVDKGSTFYVDFPAHNVAELSD